MNYEKAEKWLGDMEKKGSIYGLDCMRELMRRLGDPQNSLRFVHVAGTNGKGSVIAFLYEVMSKAGYVVGRFTSPAVFFRRETIQTSAGGMISEEAYARLLERLSRTAEEMFADGIRRPTAYELETAMAFLYFQEQGCELVLLEVGLGGDEDATNVIPTPLCGVLTPISLDHVALLGGTLSEIARHKAGIIKKGGLVVSARQEPPVMEVLLEACRRQGAVLYEAGIAEPLEEPDSPKKNSDFYQKFVYNKENIYEIALQGRHQLDNAVLALRVVELLREQGFPVEEKDVWEGLRQTRWKGRFTQISRTPAVVMDGAHNRAGALALRQTLVDYVERNGIESVVMVAGMLSDKDYEQVVPLVARDCRRLFTIPTRRTGRELTGQALERVARSHGISARSVESVAEAVKLALEELGEKELLLAFGSLSFLAEFEEKVKEHEKSRGNFEK